MPEHPVAPSPEAAATLRRGRRILLLVGIVLVTGVLVALVRNGRESRALATATAERQLPVVNVMTTGAGGAPAQVELPGTISAFNEAQVLARTTGYVRRWHVDLGARVAAGTVLIDIDAPDLDQELAQARAADGQAHASLEVARKAAARWQELRAADAVSQQEADDRVGALAELDAAARAAGANVSRLEELARFKRVATPFAGVIVRRNVEIGQFVAAGSGLPLYVLQQTDPVRVFVNVSQADSARVRAGTVATIYVAEYPDTPFAGTVTRVAGALDPATRTRQTEIDVANPDGRLLPGGYALVKLAGARTTRGVLVPTTAMLFRAEGPRMAVVDAAGRVALREIELGSDNGKEVEVLSGIAAGERVITNPPDALRDGDRVRVQGK